MAWVRTPAVVLLWFTGVTALALFAGIAWYLAPLSPGVLALQFAFTPRAFGEVVHFWSPAQLLRFRAHLPADCVLLMCYGGFGYLLATRTRWFDSLHRGRRRWIAWALPAAAFLDGAENALHWWLTDVPRFGIAWPYLLAAGCASAKWVLLLVFALAVVVAFARGDEPSA